MDSTLINVRFPRSKQSRMFKSVRAVARMLSGNGTASGGLREQIITVAADNTFDHERKAVRNNIVHYIG